MNIFGNQTAFILKTSRFSSKIAGGDFDPIFAKNFKNFKVCQISVSNDAKSKQLTSWDFYFKKQKGHLLLLIEVCAKL